MTHQKRDSNLLELLDMIQGLQHTKRLFDMAQEQLCDIYNDEMMNRATLLLEVYNERHTEQLENIVCVIENWAELKALQDIADDLNEATAVIDSIRTQHNTIETEHHSSVTTSEGG